jgi:hypothetical protein
LFGGIELVTVIGPAHDEASAGSAPRFPFAAIPTASGCLLLDRRRPRNVVSSLSRAGELLWSEDRPPRMNAVAGLADGSAVLALDRTIWLRDPDGRLRQLAILPGEAEIEALSVRDRLVAAGSDEGVQLLSLDDGRPLGSLSAEQLGVRTVTDLQLLPGDGLLITDSWQSSVLETDRRGTLIRRFGKRRVPGQALGHLTGCRSACRLPDGRTVVADTLNDRVVLISGAEAMQELWPADGSGWAAPTFVRAAGDGSLLVTDSGQRRVVALELDGLVRWQYGARPAENRPLTFPRMAEGAADGTVLVADSFSHRVLEFDGAGQEVWQAGAGLGLHAPRAVTRDAEGSTVIADGMNGRVLVVDGTGSLVREISEVCWQGERHQLVDPHHVVVAGQQLLITDSDTHWVWLVDRQGEATHRWGGNPELNDPHCARLRPDGSLVVADAGNHRLAVCAPGSESPARALPVFDAAGQPVQLDYPRCVSLAPDGGLLVSDTDAARLLGLSPDGVVRWECGPELPEHPALGGVPELRIPRWIDLSHRRLVITDYWNSRVLVYAVGPG